VNFDFGGFDFGGSGGEGAGAGQLPAISSASSSRGGGGRSGAMAQQQEAGGDLEYQIEIDFWDASARRGEKVAITRLDNLRNLPRTARRFPQDCRFANGHRNRPAGGRARCASRPCTRCGGTGKIRHTWPHLRRRSRCANGNHEVRIPRDCERCALRVPGKGNSGTMGAPPATCNLRCGGAPHPFCRAPRQ